jgi:hypothetical protein
MEAMVGNTLGRILTDKGYRGRNAPADYKFRLHLRPETGRDTPDQTPVAPQVRVEPVIGHLKAEHRMGRNYLWYRRGDAANGILAARRLQLPTPDPMAENLVASNLQRSPCGASTRPSLSATFFTDDLLITSFRVATNH